MKRSFIYKLMLKDVDVYGKRVLVRVDFNVPITDGKILDDQRLIATIPTISDLVKRGAKVILMSHLGRPNGIKISKLSLKPCASKLADLINKDVFFLDDCIGDEILNFVNCLKNGQIVLLENLRFYKQEIENDMLFSKKLSVLGDLYVNDAFGTMHRSHASTNGITNYIDCCSMGFLVSKELLFIYKVLNDPKHFFISILGGAKVSDKLKIISNLLPKVDKLILGGGMVYTFFKAKGLEIGKSLFELDKVSFVKELVYNYKEKIVLPEDCLITDYFCKNTKKIGKTSIVSVNSIKPGWYGIDIGNKTIVKINQILSTAKTIFWNGPLGIFEVNEASIGTFCVAKYIGERTNLGATSVIGGGDSALAIKRAGMINTISHISTGGGASLEFIGGNFLPGIEVLSNKI